MAGHHMIVLVSMLCVSVTGSPVLGPILCTTSGTVPEGTTAEVTCDFHRDLNRTSQFYVYKTLSGEPNIMALCAWNGGSPECRLEGGFTFKTASPDGKVIFEIPDAKASHSGDYVCKTLPADKANAVDCKLAVIETEVNQGRSVTCHTSSSVTVGEDASLFCIFTQSIDITGVTLENKNKDEIVRCNKEEGCNVLKEGYLIVEKTTSYLRVSIPRATHDKAGTYICRSTHIKQESGMCTLDVKDPDDSSKETSAIKHITLPIYAILACFLLLIVAGLVASYLHFSRRSNTDSSKRNGIQDSENEKHPLNGNGNCNKP